MEQELCRITIRGGLIAPGELKEILQLVEECGLGYIHFGSRQDILFPKTPGLAVAAARYPQWEVEEISKKTHQNILSSYVSADILPATSWLTGTSYLYILEQFRYKPELEINLVDPQQRLVPLFTGNLNFIASKHFDYWYLHLDLPGYGQPDYYPVLVHSWDIPTIAQAIEEHFEDAENIQTLFDLVSKLTETNNRTIDQDLSIPFYPFPYYEGMNRMGVDQYWLGLYWRNNRYDLAFMKAMCDLCFDCKIGKICITPWKSFIIKGIQREDKLLWEKFLGSKGINVRHSSLELNWHLPVNDPDALVLKKFLVQAFDQQDISTYGLTFGIASSYSKRFTSIVIEKNSIPQFEQPFKIQPTYSVLHSEDFDPNTCRYKVYAQDVSQAQLPGLLMELSQLYFQLLNTNTQYRTPIKKQDNPLLIVTENPLFQCSDCLSLYDEKLGDPANNMEAGTPFENLPETYCCPLCEAPKTSFLPYKKTLAPAG